MKPGDSVIFSEKPLLRAEVKDYGNDGTRLVEFQYEGLFMERLEELGSMPLPPYIERSSQEEDKERYQTVYCEEEGSVAGTYGGTSLYRRIAEAGEGKGRGTGLCDASCWDRYVPACQV